MKVLTEETWMLHPIHNDYLISTFGNVRSITKEFYNGTGGLCRTQGKLLKQHKDKKGYNRVGITMVKYPCKVRALMVHRLVAETFLANPNNYPQINHKDGIKSNNHISNLEWCNNSQNLIHAYSTSLREPIKGEENVRHKPFTANINGITQTFYSQIFASKVLGCSQSYISQCLNGKRNNNKYLLKWEIDNG